MSLYHIQLVVLRVTKVWDQICNNSVLKRVSLEFVI